ncbi:MAG TPA: hypothetical protein DCZ93_03265 [Elusimicrobia bacterium]|nr:hypothetical protein [Elusimicrobiota bacterium]
MSAYKPKPLIFAALALACSLSACGGTADSQRWEVLLLGIPEEVAVRRAAETATYYIIKQTHEPLFRRDDGQNYSSRLLKSWGRDISARQYSFCPDSSLSFDVKRYFDPEYFQGYLAGVTKKYNSEFKIGREGERFTVTFPAPQKGYLDFLTLYENAPTVVQSPGIEAGLGQFYVRSLSSEKIVLLRKAKVSDGYNEIILNEFDPSKGEKYEYAKMSDFNKLSSFDVPQEVSQNYLGFNNVQLRSDVVMINHPDRETRRQVYNCLDVDKFRKAFFPQKKEFYDVKTVLPVGVPGAAPGRPEQACVRRAGAKGKKREIVLYNHRSGNSAQLEKFAAEFNSLSGLTLKIVACTPQELVRVLHKAPRPFNLTVLGLDTVYPDYLTFFDCFVREDGYFDFKLPRIAALYAKLEREADPDLKLALVKELLGELSKEAVVLPLYQNIKRFYYPKKIKNLNIGRGFMEFPDVADFRW